MIRSEYAQLEIHVFLFDLNLFYNELYYMVSQRFSKWILKYFEYSEMNKYVGDRCCTAVLI